MIAAPFFQSLFLITDAGTKARSPNNGFNEPFPSCDEGSD